MICFSVVRSTFSVASVLHGLHLQCPVCYTSLVAVPSAHWTVDTGNTEQNVWYRV